MEWTWFRFGTEYLRNRNVRYCLTTQECEIILWNETAYPFTSGKYVIKQFMSGIRRLVNNIKGCDMCGKIKCNCKQELKTIIESKAKLCP